MGWCARLPREASCPLTLVPTPSGTRSRCSAVKMGFHPPVVATWGDENYLKDNPGDLVGLATLLGHSSLDTTRLYAQHSAEHLASRVDRLALNAYGG